MSIINIFNMIKEYRDDIKNKCKNLNKKPKLVAILANNDIEAKKYSEYTKKLLIKDGLDFELIELKKDFKIIQNKIYELENDDNVTGIIIYYPIFLDNNILDKYLQNSISKEKDVEALSAYYKNNLYKNIRYIEPNKKSILPCTALSIVKILENLIYNKNNKIGLQLHNKTITIINRSDIVGKPLASMLFNDGAIVYSVNEFNIHKLENMNLYNKIDLLKLNNIISKSDIIITGWNCSLI